jgi:hypothetical protein
VSLSHKGIELTAYHANSLPDGVKKDSHLVVIGQRKLNKLFAELDSKATLLEDGTWNTLNEDQKNRIAQLHYTPGQGIIEQVLSPWNENRTVTLLTGENDTALVRNAQLFENDEWFGKIQPGNLTVVNDDGPQSLILLKKGEARFFYPRDLRNGFQLPTWAWIAAGFFSILGVISVLRFFFGR